MLHTIENSSPFVENAIENGTTSPATTEEINARIADGLPNERRIIRDIPMEDLHRQSELWWNSLTENWTDLDWQKWQDRQDRIARKMQEYEADYSHDTSFDWEFDDDTIESVDTDHTGRVNDRIQFNVDERIERYAAHVAPYVDALESIASEAINSDGRIMESHEATYVERNGEFPALPY